MKGLKVVERFTLCVFVLLGTMGITLQGSLPAENVQRVTLSQAKNSNAVLNDYCETGTTDSRLIAGTFILTVQSSPDAGVPITVLPQDYIGRGDETTNFTRIYNDHAAVMLTAPAEFNGKKFSKWVIDEEESTGLTVSVAMTANRKLTVFYEPVIPLELELNRERLNFGCVEGGVVTGSQTFCIACSSESLCWTAAADVSWLNLNKTACMGSGKVEVSVNQPGEGLAAGTYYGTITVSSPEAVNCPVTLDVRLNVYETAPPNEPFGDFALPEDGATVSGSIPVSGWVLDEIGIANVRVYRAEGDGQVYIGDATIVEGARPDVESAYPGYPMNNRAGWGYMMLTNVFPGGGNGTFDIHAIATTTDGRVASLGKKTIYCDNANAVKPFGTIETPSQGGRVPGGSFVNWGWVLTPRPNEIPIDGSTIWVFVDGRNLGHPVYNIYRADIAGLFPDYANSSGAVGYFYLDTAGYEDGMHTIQWVATDDARNTDGIGSRFFTINNGGGRAAGEIKQGSSVSVPAGRVTNRYTLSQINRMPQDKARPVWVKKGYKPECKPETVYPGENGVITIENQGLERLEILLGENRERIKMYSGYLQVGRRLRALPAGSALDGETGIFYWQPGAGFRGEYRLVFIEKNCEGEIKRSIEITIL